VDAKKNDEWEAQIGYIKKFFEQVEWWKLIPGDQLISSRIPRSPDRTDAGVHPPAVTYWAMTAPGEVYVVYVRGTVEPLELELGSRARRFSIREFNPRTGSFKEIGSQQLSGKYRYAAPDTQDWVLLVQAQKR
jgi:hypothetical protein